MRAVNQAGIALITHFEGCRLKAYADDSGNLTIGIGHLVKSGENIPDVITQKRCDQLFSEDIACAEGIVERLVTEPLTDNQFAALVDFVFNLGNSNFKSSTLLKDLVDEDFSDAINEFKRWIYSGGKIDNGLITRRAAEKNLFLTPDGE